MKRRIAYAGAALAAVFATMAMAAPSASAGEHDWTISDPGTAQSGPSSDDQDWG